jgi:hypothetical protein
MTNSENSDNLLFKAVPRRSRVVLTNARPTESQKPVVMEILDEISTTRHPTPLPDEFQLATWRMIAEAFSETGAVNGSGGVKMTAEPKILDDLLESASLSQAAPVRKRTNFAMAANQLKGA